MGVGTAGEGWGGEVTGAGRTSGRSFTTMCGTLNLVGPLVQLLPTGVSPLPTGDTIPSWSVLFSIAWSRVTVAVPTASTEPPATVTPPASTVTTLAASVRLGSTLRSIDVD